MKVAVAKVCPCGCGTLLRPQIKQEERLSLIKVSGGRCNICKQVFCDKELAIDHIFPLFRGGLHEKGNWQVLCKSCNARKRKQDKEQPHRGIQIALLG